MRHLGQTNERQHKAGRSTGKRNDQEEFLVFSTFAVASVFGVVGLLKMLSSHAATPTTDLKPEDGALSGGVTKVADGNASGGNAVKFGGTTTGRDALVAQYGMYIPQAGLTANQVGVTAPISQLVEYNSPDTNAVSITTPVTFTNMVVYGQLKITGAGKVTAKYCWFAGPPTIPAVTGETVILDFNNPGTSGSTFVDCTIAPRFPHPRLNAFKGSRHKVERCHVFWVTDGLGPYTNPGQTFVTDVELVASRIERLVYWHGAYYANRNPYYWDGSGWPDSGTTGKTVRSAADKNTTDMIDSVHNDGNHNDCIEIHNAFGTHTFDATAKKWSGDGMHIWDNALYADDAFGQTDDPSGAGTPVPGSVGSVAGSRLGWGDNPKRDLVDGGQKPGMAMLQTSWTNPMSTSPTRYAANGAALFIGQVTNVEFEDATSVLVHDNYINGGNAGMQEQRKAVATISFQFYDNQFGPDYFMWNTGRDIYPVRINDYTTANTMPDWANGPVRIPNHPVTGAPPFGTGGSNVWLDPANKWCKNGQPLGLGSSSVAGIRVS